MMGIKGPICASHASEILPIRLYWGYLVIVEGSIGSMPKLSFLVDTGACPTVVDQKIAMRLGLAGQSARVNLSNKSVQARQVVVPFLLCWANPGHLPSRSDGRSLFFSKGYGSQGRCDCGSGCP